MARPDWTFLGNHAHVLICLAREGDLRVRDLAAQVGITERAVSGILSDLVAGGYLSVEKDGRRNRYQVQANHPLRHPVEAGVTLAELLDLMSRGS